MNWRSAAYLSRLGLRLWRATTVEETRRRPGGWARDKGSQNGEGRTAPRKETREKEAVVAGSAAAMEADVVWSELGARCSGMCRKEDG